MKNAIKNRKGEGYIDTAVGVVCAMMVIVLALNIFLSHASAAQTLF